MPRPSVRLSRIAQFSSAHRLHNPDLADSENQRIFGKCNSPNGHGHNYKVQVTVVGSLDSNGMVLNLSVLKDIIQKEILDVFDHKFIDLDIPYFRTTTSTAENIAIFIYDKVSKALGETLDRIDIGDAQYRQVVKLEEIKLWETECNVVVYRGE